MKKVLMKLLSLEDGMKKVYKYLEVNLINDFFEIYGCLK